MGYLNQIVGNGNGSGERGPRGVAGRGIGSITSQDNADGSINLTINYDDGSPSETFVNTLVSDTLLQLEKLTLEGTNNSTKFSIKQADETIMFQCNTLDGLNFLKNAIIGDDIQNETTINSDIFQSKTVSGTTLNTDGNILLNGFKNRLKSTNGSNNCFLDISANDPDNIFRFVTSNSENEISLTMNPSDNIWNGQMIFNTLPRGNGDAPVNDEDFVIKSYVDNEDNIIQSLTETAQLTAENAQATANNAVSKTTVSSQSIQSDFIIQGNPSVDKFVVRDEQNNKIFWVETTSDSIFLGGSNSGAKWGLFDLQFNLTFLLDTQGQTMRLGNEDINNSVLLFNYLQGMITTRTINGGIGYSGFKAENTLSSSNIQMLSSYNLSLPNKLQSIGGSGLLISSDFQMIISSPITIFDAAQPIPLLQKNPVDFTQPSQIVNKVYVDDRVGGICSGTSASLTAVGTNLAPQLLNPLSFLPNSPTVPANYLKAGQSYQLNMSGTATFTNGNAFVITLQSAAIILGSISITVPNVTATQTWELEADFTIRSITNNIANVACSFDFTYNTGAQDFIGRRSITISNTLPTNINNTLQVWIDYSSGSATSNITTELYILRKVIDV